MTFANVINVVLIVVCACVFLQVARMNRRMRAFREKELAIGVKQFEEATDQARKVLAELKQVLSTDGVEQAQLIASAEEIRDELSVMVGIGNSVAERIMDAAQKASKISEMAQNSEAQLAQSNTEEKTSSKPRRRKSRSNKAVVAKPVEAADALDANAVAEKLVAEILDVELEERSVAASTRSRVPARGRSRRKVLTGKAKPAANDVSDVVAAPVKAKPLDESAVA